MNLSTPIALLALGAAGFGTWFHSSPAPVESRTVDPLIGQILWVPYNFAPRGWAMCDGQLLPIKGNEALFSLLGTTYGGDGRTTFGLPDLRGRMPMHAGAGPGLTERDLGKKGGVERVTLTVAEMPNHTHGLRTESATNIGSSAILAETVQFTTAGEAEPQGVLENAGGSQSHENMPPYLTLHAVIALQGAFPSRS